MNNVTHLQRKLQTCDNAVFGMKVFGGWGGNEKRNPKQTRNYFFSVMYLVMKSNIGQLTVVVVVC